MDTQPAIGTIGVSHTACEDEFRQIFDLTAGVYSNSHMYGRTFGATGRLNNDVTGVVTGIDYVLWYMV